MEERDALALRTEAWHFIDDVNTVRLASREHCVNVVHVEANVVNAWSSLGKELPNGGFGLLGFEQFHKRLAGCDRFDAGAVGIVERDFRHSEDISVQRQNRLKGLDGDTEMGDAGTAGCGIGHCGEGRRGRTSGRTRLTLHWRPGTWHRMRDPGRETMSKTVHVTDDSFAVEVEQHQGLAVVDFWATWCGPCRMIAPILDQLSEEFDGRVKVTKLDVDANQKTATRFQVRSIPTLLFFKDGKLVDQVIGAVPKPALAAKFEQHAA